MKGLSLWAEVASKSEPTQGESSALRHWKLRFWQALQAAGSRGRATGCLPSFWAESKFHKESTNHFLFS